jgi:DNA-binding NtrC family response regulator
VEWLQELRDQEVTTDVIVMTAYADLETSIAALRSGASDFLLKPFRVEQMMTAVRRCLERRRMVRENFLLRRDVRPDGIEGIVGASSAISDMCAVVQRVAPTASTVLIEGETGTGKELVARAIHALSGRDGPFVPVNCGSISPELLESELFGHTKGAFTSAHSSREGLFSYARDGTLFLDEISEMSLAMQAKLLRALEEKRVRPVGADREVPVNARVIAATNRQLASEMNEGNFREDLFFRLNVLAIMVPPLREHPDDIPALAEHFSAMLSGDRADAGLLMAGERARAQERDRAVVVAGQAAGGFFRRGRRRPGRRRRRCRAAVDLERRSGREASHIAGAGEQRRQQVEGGAFSRGFPQDPGAQAQELDRELMAAEPA